MPKSNAVWGIDIGNAALKAVRCRVGDAPDEIVTDAFDFIEYPKILSEPGAEPGELVADAIKEFLKRNSVKGEPVAMSVPGQTGLARFIKLPPVETKKIPDIVSYEARQQIPFDLDDVVWDYQQMPGATVEEGFALEAEVGIFAMKHEQVHRVLEPLTSAGVEVEMVQLAPLALYNFLVFDQMQDLPPADEYIPEAPPPSLVILSMGTDATDLVVTNGFRVWQRSIPLGGNHFTRALTKELKLTFAKAEHLKRNATAAEDPKAVFQAMRPVFSDLLTEIQRSIGYFTTIDRSANIDYVVGLGNAMKLPGLRKYLSQSLGYDVKLIDSFRGLTGDEVVQAPAFKENHLSFATAYGLATQALGKASLTTNLLPAEILKERMIKAKKPWAVAAMAVLLMGLSVSFVSYTRALATVDEERFGPSESSLDQVVSRASQLKSEESAALSALDGVKTIGTNLTSNVEGRILWLELLKAINVCLPSDEGKERPEVIWERNELYVKSISCEPTEELATWFTYMKDNEWYLPPGGELESGSSAAVDPEAEAEAEADPGPSGEGFVVQITGYHFHNRPTPDNPLQGAQFVRQKFMVPLREMSVELPYRDENGEEQMEWVTMKDLGIGYPSLVDPPRPRVVEVQDPTKEPNEMARSYGSGDGYRDGSGDEYSDDYSRGGDDYSRGRGYSEDQDYGDDSGYRGDRSRSGEVVVGEEEINPAIKLGVQDFKVQFTWQPTPPSVRRARKAEEAAAKAAQEALEAGEELPDATEDAGDTPEDAGDTPEPAGDTPEPAEDSAETGNEA